MSPAATSSPPLQPAHIISASLECHDIWRHVMLVLPRRRHHAYCLTRSEEEPSPPEAFELISPPNPPTPQPPNPKPQTPNPNPTRPLHFACDRGAARAAPLKTRKTGQARKPFPRLVLRVPFSGVGLAGDQRDTTQFGVHFGTDLICGLKHHL